MKLFIMKILKILPIILFIFFSSLTSIVYAETLNFAAATYEGETKKGKANGIGTFTFNDGSKYEGKVKKNKISGMGKYTDAQGNVLEGKFRNGTIKIKIDKKTREIIKLKPKTGVKIYAEIKGTGSVSTKCLELKKIH